MNCFDCFQCFCTTSTSSDGGVSTTTTTTSISCCVNHKIDWILFPYWKNNNVALQPDNCN